MKYAIRHCCLCIALLFGAVSAFAIKTFRLTVSSTDCGILLSDNYPVNAVINITPTPLEGYLFKQWSDGNTDTPRQIILTSDMTIQAVFEKIRTPYTVRIEQQQGGIVTGGGTYYEGDKITLTAIAYEGYEFIRWNDGNTERERQITVTDNATYFAVFLRKQCSIRLSTSDCGILYEYQHSYGITIHLHATPLTGQTFVRWSDGVELQQRTVTITQDTAITAIFVSENEQCDYETTDGATVWEDELPYTWESVTFNEAGTETLTLQASDGCDSVVTFTLRVRHRNIVLQENKDAQYYDFFAEDYNGYTVNTATLNRQFAQGKWATLCLPFDVRKGQMISLGLYGRVFEFRYADVQDATVVLHFAVAQSIEAGKGYIVNANAKLAQKTSFVFANVTINTDADNGDITTLTGYNDNSGRGNLYLVGTLRTGLLQGSTGGNTYMGLKDNKLYYPNTTNGTAVRAYRGFFRSGIGGTIEEGDDNDEPTAPQRVRIVVEGETVGELEVMNEELYDAGEDDRAPRTHKFINNGILYIRCNGKTYNAQGAEVR